MKLNLPDVMLCAAASVNVAATVEAMRRTIGMIDFGDCVLFTDDPTGLVDPDIRVVTIPRISSGREYSDFVLGSLVDHVTRKHCMIVQWDGFPTQPDNWEQAFLDCDYIGAPWPQFSDGHDVGNGGFSIRSRRLMELCRSPRFQPSHPEDVAICRSNRDLMEREGMRFANHALASRFSRERSGEQGRTFGMHGVFNMVEAIGQDQFWTLYLGLDERGTVWPDKGSIARQMLSGRHGLRRATAIFCGKFLERLESRK